MSDLEAERVVFAPSTDRVYVFDIAEHTWSAWESADDDSDGYETGELPADVGVLYSDRPSYAAQCARADAAGAKLREIREMLQTADDDYITAYALAVDIELIIEREGGAE